MIVFTFSPPKSDQIHRPIPFHNSSKSTDKIWQYVDFQNFFFCIPSVPCDMPNIKRANTIWKKNFKYVLDRSICISSRTTLSDRLSSCDNVLIVKRVQKVLLYSSLEYRLQAAHLKGLANFSLLSLGLWLSRVIQLFIYFTFNFTAFICTNKITMNPAIWKSHVTMR